MRVVGRRAGLALALLGMAGAMAWWAWAAGTGRTGLVGVLDRGDGEEVVLSLVAVRAIDGPSRYTVGHALLAVPVEGPTDALRVGEELTVGGVVDGDHVRASWVAPAPERGAKKRLGVLGVVLAAGVGAGAVRFDRAGRGLALRGR